MTNNIKAGYTDDPTLYNLVGISLDDGSQMLIFNIVGAFDLPVEVLKIPPEKREYYPRRSWFMSEKTIPEGLTELANSLSAEIRSSGDFCHYLITQEDRQTVDKAVSEFRQ